MSIISDKISSINQRLDKLTLDINSNLTINEVRSEANDLTLGLGTSGKLKVKSWKKSLQIWEVI